jgi:hypothetical protein
MILHFAADEKLFFLSSSPATLSFIHLPQSSSPFISFHFDHLSLKISLTPCSSIKEENKAQSLSISNELISILRVDVLCSLLSCKNFPHKQKESLLERSLGFLATETNLRFLFL